MSPRAVLRPFNVCLLGAGLLACGSDKAGPEPAASASAAASAGSLASASVAAPIVFPPGCDYLVVPGKHILPRNPAEPPFQSTQGRELKTGYCYQGIHVWDLDALDGKFGCKHRGTTGSDHLTCPGVYIRYSGPGSFLEEITIAPLPP